MEIIKAAVAGSLESNDALVSVFPNAGKGITLSISSIVYQQFSQQITKTAKEAIALMGVKDGVIQIEDKGALDCTLRARVIAAITRASKE